MNLQNRWQAISATKYNRGLKKIHSSIEGIQSGSGNDELIGNARNNSLYSFHGDDWLFGGTGKDRLYGGEGEDIFQLAKGRGHAILHDYSYDDDWLYIDVPFSRLSVDYRRKDARIFDGNDIIAYVPGFAGATLQDYGDGYVALG